jgi:fructokinase
LESPAFEVDDARDTAGAGDWCTAGLIHRLGQAGAAGLLEVEADELRDALRFGQAMAAWNCRFEGARGGMYQTDTASFREDVLRILDGGQASSTGTVLSDNEFGGLSSGLCLACGDTTTIQTARPVG